MRTLRQIVEKLLVGGNHPASVLWNQWNLRRSRHLYGRFESLQDVFSHHYRENTWRSEESVSGPGSTLGYTENLRSELPLVLDRLGARRILDAPCGDYNWFGRIPRSSEVHYLGADIVEPLIDANREAHENENTRFEVLDITHDSLPAADLWIVRDCLQHLSNEDIFRALRRFFRSEIDYVLASTHTECRHNADIASGGYRYVNLELPPFAFGPPILSIDDWIEGYPVKTMSLWKREPLARLLADSAVAREWFRL